LGYGASGAGFEAREGISVGDWLEVALGSEWEGKRAPRHGVVVVETLIEKHFLVFG
jgi:hypothetical protein